MEAELDSIYRTETLKNKQNGAHKNKKEFQRMKGRMSSVWRNDGFFLRASSPKTKESFIYDFIPLRKLKSGSTFLENNMSSKPKGPWWFE